MTMLSDAIHFDRVEFSPNSQVASLTQGLAIDDADKSTISPIPVKKNTGTVEMVARQETGDDSKMNNEESDEARIERLGRQRPEKFKTLWSEIGFVFSVVMSQVMTVSI